MTKVIIATKDGMQRVELLQQNGQFAAVHDSRDGRYSITHLPAGAMVLSTAVRDDVLSARVLAGLAVLPAFDLQTAPDHADAIKAIVSDAVNGVGT